MTFASKYVQLNNMLKSYPRITCTCIGYYPYLFVAYVEFDLKNVGVKKMENMSELWSE